MHNKRLKNIILFISLTAILLTGCSQAAKNQAIKLDPKNPVTISVWHYYNGVIMNTFDSFVKEFNETIGAEKGIIVEASGMGTNVAELEKAVIASANKEVGSLEMPNIFASYADTAYAAEKMNLLANLSDHFTVEEQEQYIESYIEEGKIGLNGELRIFPIAKSTEALMINETDWLPFADACGLTYDDLTTMEDIARVSEMYYNWTNAQTPDNPNDGKSFFGRDSIANLFIIASKEFDAEIFNVKNGAVTINIDENVMRKIWDNYYVPYISGYFFAYGKFRSEDTRVGDILCYIGSTSSTAYFPTMVTVDGEEHPIMPKVLPFPHFKDGKRVMVQQGAGMVVTKSTPEMEYASILFLKWFTEPQQNIKFAAYSGYMPVKKEAANYDTFTSNLAASDYVLDEITSETLKIAFAETNTSELYTTKAFDGGADARTIIDTHLQKKADNDREAILLELENGSTLEQAVALFNTEENFNNWLRDFTEKLNN